MAPNWYKEAEKKLQAGEKIVKSYPGSLDGKKGYVFITSDRLLFEHVKGFLSKSYEIVFDTPLKDIESMNLQGRYKIELSVKGAKHILGTEELPANVIKNNLQEAIDSKTSPPVVT